jgi:transcriptional regulator with XRE-family HTH domain
MEKPEWGPRYVQVIASQVRRYRTERGMSAQALSDACGALGWPIKRSVLSNLESGYRETVTVPELVVLARALEVPPVQLVYPLGTTAEVEVLPGETVKTEDAMLWFTGWRDLFKDEAETRIGHGNQSPESGLHEWYETGYDDAGAPVHLYAEHRQLLDEYSEATMEAARRLGSDAPAAKLRSEVAAIRKRSEDAIRAKRAEMRRRGITVLPDLPSELEHLT